MSKLSRNITSGHIPVRNAVDTRTWESKVANFRGLWDSRIGITEAFESAVVNQQPTTSLNSVMIWVLHGTLANLKEILA